MTDFFQQRYYKINKFFLSILGLWPYQSRPRRFALVVFFTILVTSQIIPQILAVVKFWDDPEVVIQSIPPFATDLICGINVANIIFNFDKMSELVNRMKIDWISLVHQPEVVILQDYAEIGRVFTISYTVGMYFCLVLFMGQPAAPKILKALKFSNKSEPGQFPFPVDYYGIDMETYYYFMLIHSVICVTVIITVLIAADTMFMVYVQHACGMFAVVGHQLKRMADGMEKHQKDHFEQENSSAFHYLVICIKKHKDAIEFGEFLESSYTWAFFCIVGINMVMMSVTGYQTVAKMDERPQDAIRYAVFTVAQMLHLFFLSFFSESLRTHSEQIRDYAYQSEWYRSSIYTQKLLSLVIMRTYVPCQLTAGKLMVMSLENYTSVVKTSMSYFTLLRSMQ